MKNLLITGALAVALLIPASMAQAKTNVDVDIGLGNGFGNGYYNSYDDRNWNKRGWRDRVSCQEGKQVLRHNGFRNVDAVMCGKRVYSYEADKRGQSFRIQMNRNGRIIDIDRTRN